MVADARSTSQSLAALPDALPWCPLSTHYGHSVCSNLKLHRRSASGWSWYPAIPGLK